MTAYVWSKCNSAKELKTDSFSTSAHWYGADGRSGQPVRALATASKGSNTDAEFAPAKIALKKSALIIDSAALRKMHPIADQIQRVQSHRPGLLGLRGRLAPEHATAVDRLVSGIVVLEAPRVVSPVQGQRSK